MNFTWVGLSIFGVALDRQGDALAVSLLVPQAFNGESCVRVVLHISAAKGVLALFHAVFVQSLHGRHGFELAGLDLPGPLRVIKKHIDAHEPPGRPLSQKPRAAIAAY